VRCRSDPRIGSKNTNNFSTLSQRLLEFRQLWRRLTANRHGLLDNFMLETLAYDAVRKRFNLFYLGERNKALELFGDAFSISISTLASYQLNTGGFGISISSILTRLKLNYRSVSNSSSAGTGKRQSTRPAFMTGNPTTSGCLSSLLQKSGIGNGISKRGPIDCSDPGSAPPAIAGGAFSFCRLQKSGTNFGQQR